MSRLPKLAVILGPTASGKTDMALKLAKKFKGEIVNADSRQIYRGMDVATAKPPLSQKPKVKSQNYKSKLKSKELKKIYYGEVDGVRHWLMDVVDPDEEFTMADFKNKAVAAINDILKRGKVPFLVGGTGLYIQSVVDNLIIPSVPPNKALRRKFEGELAKAKELGIRNYELGILKKWHKKLLKLDPSAKDVVDANNPRRIIRALEVCLATGRPFSELREKGKPLFDVLQIGINIPREKLYKNIDQRVEQMIEQGLVAETQKLIKKFSARGGSALGGQVLSFKFKDLPSMSGIGYKEIGEYLNENLKFKIENLRKEFLEKKVQEIKYRTHAYARRQMTWFRRDKRIKWIKNYKEAEDKIKKWA